MTPVEQRYLEHIHSKLDLTIAYEPKSGIFTAQSITYPSIQAIGSSRDDAINKLQQKLIDQKIGL